MRLRLPSYILAMDIKGGYNNVNLGKLKGIFNEKVIPTLEPEI